ncbi:MAG: PAS domain-containing protein [Desulfobacterales bacterium]
MTTFSEILKDNEDWLMQRILDYAIRLGYAAYTSTLKEAWRQSIAGLSASIMEAIRSQDFNPELRPDDNLADDPVAQFGIVEAQRHRERGVSLEMYLGLMKYYRQAYIDLLRRLKLGAAETEKYELSINRIFDRIEIGFCIEWSGADEKKSALAMQTSNLLMTNEKNKYLTIFESIPNPVIILNRGKKIDNMNLAAARLFKEGSVAGSQYYCSARDRQLEMEHIRTAADDTLDPNCYGGHAFHRLLPWLKDEVDRFYRQDETATEFEKVLSQSSRKAVYRIKIAKNLDVSEKFDGAIIILEDITALKNALSEVKTLRGFVPICSHCKNIRDDKGFWQQVEEYVQSHSEAQFSHSICPDCAKKLYPAFKLVRE